MRSFRNKVSPTLEKNLSQSIETVPQRTIEKPGEFNSNSVNTVKILVFLLIRVVICLFQTEAEGLIASITAINPTE